MLILRYVLVILGIGLFGSAGALVAYDVYAASQLRRLLRRQAEAAEGAPSTTSLLPRAAGPARWRRALQLAGLTGVPILLSQSIIVIPDGTAEAEASRIRVTAAAIEHVRAGAHDPKVLTDGD